MKILNTKITYTREKLSHPFGFKGGYLSELWQVISRVDGECESGMGVGVQSVLWADSDIFSRLPESDGNMLMYRISEHALGLLRGKEGENPIELIDSIFPSLLSFAKDICGENVRETFVRNALVTVDNALWQLYGKEKKTDDLMTLIPENLTSGLKEKQSELLNIPLVTYGVSDEGVHELLKGGASLLKIKIGNDDGGKRSKEEMLLWDKKRALAIHNIAKGYRSDATVSGNILYYFDANQRYDTPERVKELLAFMDEHGILSRTVIFEEPFDEFNKAQVASLPVRVAADESVHSLADVEERIALGYRAVALKPIAKTLSETLKILTAAEDAGVYCFCADLTVNPLMVEWNKNIAARIKKLPEMKMGILESNGAQNYERWGELEAASPAFGKAYAEAVFGIYHLNDEFFLESGSIFKPAEYYENLIK